MNKVLRFLAVLGAVALFFSPFATATPEFAKKESKAGPFVIVFLGINGTGKTTTVAKVANLLRKAGFSVVVAAGDTHRAGAIERAVLEHEASV